MKHDSLLLRQIHPSWIRNGKITSQAFNPTRNHAYLLSVYDGELISPRDSCIHFTTVLGRRSVGVVAVTVDECKALGLSVRSEPDGFPEHAVVDFTALTTSSSRKDAAKQLADYAMSRAWQYRVDTG